MHKLIIAFTILPIILVLSIACSSASAVGSSVVISKVQLGDVSSLSNEFVEIYNNSDAEIDITNWCLYYASALNTGNGSKMACITTENQNLHLFLPSHASLLATSSQATLDGDTKFSATLSGMAGHIRLIDSRGAEVDKLAWGNTAVSPEGEKPAVASVIGTIMSRRHISDAILQDTDVNFYDFENISAPSTFLYGAIYEVQDLCSNIDDIQIDLPNGYSVDTNSKCSPPPADVCGNLDGLQIAVPKGYAIDAGNNCQPDACINIDGLQLIIPENLVTDGVGGCVAPDLCLNLLGIQAEVPGGYLRSGENDCRLNLLTLKISELLPNAIGDDDGSEFIEIYNPNNSNVDLANYQLLIGSESKHFIFPIGSVIAANSYRAFSNEEIKFTLTNTSGIVKIYSIDGYMIDESEGYDSAGEDISWNLIDNLWQYSNQLTPGSVNLPSIVDSEIIETNSALAPCAANQYRSPETNRCRLIPLLSSALTPCKDGQYRSEETNRCRNIVADVVGLVPCAEGQERNPTTNRCRTITGAVLGVSDLKPCKAGQERNPDTNRCRNVAAAIATVDYAPEQVNQTENNNVITLSFIGVGVLAIGYGIWEWRLEIKKSLGKLREMFSK